MDMTLSGPSYPPKSGGKPSRLVILLHGLGADGNDLIGLAPYWAPLLPDAEFLSPNAPFPCEMAPYGYQWLSDPRPEPRGAARRRIAPRRPSSTPLSMPSLAKRQALGDADLALVGFSQGTMMSLFVGPRREKPLAGIVGYSGRLIAPALLGAEIRSRPPILCSPTAPRTRWSLLRSDGGSRNRAEGCRDPGRDADACPGVGHGIDEDGLRRGGQFLHRVLSPPGS